MNQSRNTIALIIFSALFLTAVFACKSSQKAVAKQDQYAPVAQTEPAAKGRSSLEDDYRAMTAAYTPWADVSVPVKVQVKKPKNISVSGTLSMSYGKSMSLTLKMLFIDVATVYADTDSVIIVSKAAGAYFAESMKRFTAASGLTLADLQSLMLGQAFTPGNGTAKPNQASQFSLAEDKEISGEDFRAWSMAPKKMPKGVDWHFTAIAPTTNDTQVTPQIFALDIEAGTNKLLCTFAQSELTAAGTIASMMQIEGSVKKHAVDMVISGSASRASWNTGRTPTRPSIPRNAKRLGTEQIFKMLNKF